MPPHGRRPQAYPAGCLAAARFRAFSEGLWVRQPAERTQAGDDERNDGHEQDDGVFIARTKQPVAGAGLAVVVCVPLEKRHVGGRLPPKRRGPSEGTSADNRVRAPRCCIMRSKTTFGTRTVAVPARAGQSLRRRYSGRPDQGQEAMIGFKGQLRGSSCRKRREGRVHQLGTRRSATRDRLVWRASAEAATTCLIASHPSHRPVPTVIGPDRRKKKQISP